MEGQRAALQKKKGASAAVGRERGWAAEAAHLAQRAHVQMMDAFEHTQLHLITTHSIGRATQADAVSL